jgi:diguanylate cyclase (GGDEF)-like protein
LDDFKKVNDRHGHLVGSHVLMEVAAVILLSVRDTDAVARYGGDEFVVVLPDTGTELAGAVAERIRGKIRKYEFTGGKRLQLSLTASFGVATFPLHASSPQQLIACADTAMYEAKAANKNCVRFAAVTNTAAVRSPHNPFEQAEPESPPPPSSFETQSLEVDDTDRPS